MMNMINGKVHGGKVFVNLTPYEVEIMDDGEVVRVPPRADSLGQGFLTRRMVSSTSHLLLWLLKPRGLMW